MMIIFLSPTTFAECGKPKAWWETAFPGSYETKRTTIDYSDDRGSEYNEYGNSSDEYGNNSSDSPEPVVYHWDNIYLEPNYPEVIVDPYGEMEEDDDF